ncbi:hypothetical protein AXG93_2062s1020 [Marchantia polymorpha subsp. ruderalis]|uniref:Uncharacterized protein n=1 Tax=Marchantia polymorpha subsp. ruderalis TaxID=1480154 RepID=A0A176VFK5_MARPO|nr:hypothetical protein AXG93_2062s1020 [Marchantia polymorpha subsp. ruderalis]
MVREWLREQDQPPGGYRSHPERWRVSDWEQVLGRCAGEEGDLLFECESVHLSKEEEITFGALFKNRKSSKNGYRTREYVDRKRRNVAVALFQILQPHWTTYMSSWQVGFVELALAGTPIHWARILWRATHQHAGEEKGVSINHLSPFLINFYWSIGYLTAEEKIQFTLLSRTNPERLVRDVEVDTDLDEVPAITPPARLRAEEEPRGARAPRKRKLDGEAELSRRELLAVPVRRRAINEQARLKQKARKLILPTDSSADTRRAAIARDSSSSEEDTRVPSAEPPSAGLDWEDVVGPSGAGSPTPLEVLVEHGVEAPVEEAARPSARESPRISAATEIIETEEYTPSEEEEKAALKLGDEMMINVRREIDELRAKVQTDLSVEQVQSRNLADELVRKT